MPEWQTNDKNQYPGQESLNPVLMNTRSSTKNSILIGQPAFVELRSNFVCFTRYVVQVWVVRDEWQVHRRHSDFGGRHRFVQIKKGLVLV